MQKTNLKENLFFLKCAIESAQVLQFNSALLLFKKKYALSPVMPNSLFLFWVVCLFVCFFSYELFTDFNHVQITDNVKVCLNLVCFSFPFMFFIFGGTWLD